MKWDEIMKKNRWTSDDITFCVSKCNYKSCDRHLSNIHHPELLHSFAELKNTVYCEKYPIKDNKKG